MKLPCSLEALECFHLPVLVNLYVIISKLAPIPWDSYWKHLSSDWWLIHHHLYCFLPVVRDQDYLSQSMALLLILLDRWFSLCGSFHFFHGLLTWERKKKKTQNEDNVRNLQDKANPLATVLSAAMLLRYGLGEDSVAKRIEAAVIETLNQGFRTGDIFSSGTVSRFIFTFYPFSSLGFIWCRQLETAWKAHDKNWTFLIVSFIMEYCNFRVLLPVSNYRVFIKYWTFHKTKQANG